MTGPDATKSPAGNGLVILNPRPEYDPPPFQPAPNIEYRLLGAVVEDTLGPTPRPRRTTRKRQLLADLTRLADIVADHDGIQRASVYTAVMIPPAAGPRHGPDAAAHARYDVVVLIEATPGTPEPASAVQEMRALLEPVSRETLDISARCLRCVADVEKTRQGLYLFNYFAAANLDAALELWGHLAAWYMAETGLENSTLLQPLQDCPYVFINHARWDRTLASFAATQFTKPTFRSYVLANLKANHTIATPILYHLAHTQAA